MYKILHLILLFSFLNAQNKKVIFTESAPAPIGAYSQAIQTDKWLFVSGQIGMDKSGKMDTASIENQTRQVMENLKSILESAGYSMENVVKATVYIKNMNDFPIINKVFGAYFKNDPPARETVEVCRLPKNAKVEISVIAIRP